MLGWITGAGDIPLSAVADELSEALVQAVPAASNKARLVNQQNFAMYILQLIIYNMVQRFKTCSCAGKAQLLEGPLYWYMSIRQRIGR